MAKTTTEVTANTTLTSWDWLIILYNKVQTANKLQGKGYDFITKSNRQQVIDEVRKIFTVDEIRLLLKAVMLIIKSFYKIRGCVYKVSNPDKAIIKEQQEKIEELEAKLAAANKKKTTKKKTANTASKKTASK